jgi:PPOX class probable F420-dependent enzyme
VVAEQLGNAHIHRFLATREVIVLATVQPDGSPLATPVWFLHRANTLTMVSEAATQKVRNLRRDRRVCVVADAGARSDNQGVIIRGYAEFLAESPERQPLVEALLEKYHPDLRHRWGGGMMPQDRVMFRIVAQQVRSWGLSP